MQTNRTFIVRLALLVPVAFALLSATFVNTASAQTSREAARKRAQHERLVQEHARLGAKLRAGHMEQRQDMGAIRAREAARKRAHSHHKGHRRGHGDTDHR